MEDSKSTLFANNVCKSTLFSWIKRKVEVNLIGIKFTDDPKTRKAAKHKRREQKYSVTRRTGDICSLQNVTAPILCKGVVCS